MDLLTAENIREVTDHPEDFVPKVILKLKSLGSGAGQRTLSDLFKWVGAIVKGTSGNGVGAGLPCDEMEHPSGRERDVPSGPKPMMYWWRCPLRTMDSSSRCN